MIKYSNGQTFKPKNKREHHLSSEELSFSSANRGMNLEEDINNTNNYYKDKDICLIYKRPTPINVVKVDYSKGAIITQAYFEEQSTTDYNGVYLGKYIDFEAKNTKSKTSFPLSNIHKHQIEHLKKVIYHGGIAFFIIQFEKLGKIYLLDAQKVIDLYESSERKSIPVDYFLDNGIELQQGYNPRIDYIKAIDRLYF